MDFILWGAIYSKNVRNQSTALKFMCRIRICATNDDVSSNSGCVESVAYQKEEFLSQIFVFISNPACCLRFYVVVAAQLNRLFVPDFFAR